MYAMYARPYLAWPPAPQVRMQLKTPPASLFGNLHHMRNELVIKFQPGAGLCVCARVCGVRCAVCGVRCMLE